MSTRHYLVLGGSGFIGSHLLAALARSGCQATVLSRNREQRRAINLLPNVYTVSADVYDRATLEQHLAGKHAVINLVGILNETGGASFTHAHVDLTATVIAACRQVGVKRIHQMSSVNAGARDSKYLRTRGEAEAQVRNSGLDWTIYRPSVVFGRGDGLVFRFLQLLQWAPILPLARPHAVLAPVWVGDVVAAIVRGLADRASIAQVYELYGPESLQLIQLVRMIRDAAGLRRMVVPLPDSLGRLQAWAAEWLPGKPFSRDNFASLGLAATGNDAGLARLGISPHRFSTLLPELLAGRANTLRMDAARASQVR